jgi:hypothetical protein
MNTLKFEHQLNEDDYAALLVFSVFEKKRFNKVFLLFITPLFGILFLFYFIFMGEPDFFAIFISSFLVIFGPFFRWLYVYLGKKAYHKSTLLQVKSEIVFSDKTIEANSERENSKYFYTDISNVYETKRHFIIYLGMSHFIGLVKLNMGESTSDQVRVILQEKVNEKYIDRS